MRLSISQNNNEKLECAHWSRWGEKHDIYDEMVFCLGHQVIYHGFEREQRLKCG